MSRWITIEAAELAVKALEEENARLKAENERLRSFTTRTIIPNEQLQAQVERLTKAGDAMANVLKDGGVIVSGYSLADEWLKAKLHAAKDGKDIQ